MNNINNCSVSPANAGVVHMVQSKDLWVEGSAVEQLKAVACLDGVTRVVGLPDLQPGRGYPVGSATLTHDRLIPIIIDKDIGCGMLFASFGKTRINASKVAKKLASRFFSWEGLSVTGEQFRALLEKPSSWSAHLEGVFPGSGDISARHLTLAYGVQELATRENDNPIADLLINESLEISAKSIGTIGVGNHFVEIQKLAELQDLPLAEQFGLHVGDTGITIHSGSRSFGYTLAEQIFWQCKETGTGIAIPPTSPLWARYRAAMQLAVNYAALNRLVLALRMREFINPDSTAIIMDRPHNFAEIVKADKGPFHVIHRKGAAPAHFNTDAADPVLIPGSMGNESWFCVAGAGVNRTLNSVNHGVGRKWQRTVAAEKLHRKSQEKGMRAVTGKGEVVCADTDHLFEEGGDAYKNVESVMACAEGADLIRRVARLEPVLTMRE